MIKLILLQTTHILQYLTDILSKHTQHFIKTYKYYNFLHFRPDGPPTDLRISPISVHCICLPSFYFSFSHVHSNSRQCLIPR